MYPEQDKARYVKRMFASIADRYDAMNRLMSLGRDMYWRRLAVRSLSCSPGARVLDVGTGTGDFLPLLAEAGYRPVGADLTWRMMQVGREKLAERGDGFAMVTGDALSLPFASESFDAVINGFLLRNLQDVSAALAEMLRVMKAGGQLVCLEITWPRHLFLRYAFGLYFGRLVPLVIGSLAGQRWAYSYLPRSVVSFMCPDELAETMRRAGFREVSYSTLGLGTVMLHVGVK